MKNIAEFYKKLFSFIRTVFFRILCIFCFTLVAFSQQKPSEPPKEEGEKRLDLDFSTMAEGIEKPPMTDSEENEIAPNPTIETTKNTQDATPKTKEIPREPIAIPPKRPPKQYNTSAATSESGKEAEKKARDTIAYGIDTEIADLIDSLKNDEDNRFVNDIYDIFYETKSVAIREKIIEYFTKLEDPCLEDYAVGILAEPYEEPGTTVDLIFTYVSKAKVTSAAPATKRLIEEENEQYFNQAVRTLGDIGNDSDAVFLSEYMARDDLLPPQKQELVKALGKLKALDTYDKLVELATDTNENSFVRKYAAEAIGAMEKPEAIAILVKLFEDNDPGIRSYVIKGIAHFNTKESNDLILQAIRDTHYSVRLEAIKASKDLKLLEAVPYLIYRAKNDNEANVKNECYRAIAELDTAEGNDFLISLLDDKNEKNDGTKARVAAALLEKNSAGTQQVIELAHSVLDDNRRKPLRYALGKEFAKYERSVFVDICKEYLASNDVPTQGTGLDIYAKNRFPSLKTTVEEIATQEKEGANKTKAKKILDRE